MNEFLITCEGPGGAVNRIRTWCDDMTAAKIKAELWCRSQPGEWRVHNIYANIETTELPSQLQQMLDLLDRYPTIEQSACDVVGDWVDGKSLAGRGSEVFETDDRIAQADHFIKWFKDRVEDYERNSA